MRVKGHGGPGQLASSLAPQRKPCSRWPGTWSACGHLREAWNSPKGAHQFRPAAKATNQSATARSKTGADPEVPGEVAILCNKYQELARHHLKRLPALFRRLTGLCSHLSWAPIGPGRWSPHALPTHSRVCRQAVSRRAEVVTWCQNCSAHHLALAVKSGHKGHGFTCALGVRNFWLPIIVRGCIVALAFVQALASPGTAAWARPHPARHVRPSASRNAVGASRLANRRTKRGSDLDFLGAAKLLHLVFEHVETSALADLRKSDLTRAQQALSELQTVATRLRSELNGLDPSFNKTAPLMESQNHTDRLVHAALEHIHQHYTHPFTLQECAREMRLNAAYLSAQFSRVVGVPFKTFLTELRIEKARELLGHPAISIADVASAVGYASENRFRIAFRQVTGLSPRQWRETLRMPPQGTA